MLLNTIIVFNLSNTPLIHIEWYCERHSLPEFFRTVARLIIKSFNFKMSNIFKLFDATLNFFYNFCVEL